MGWGVCVGGWGGASAAEARAGKAGQSHTPRGRSRGSGSCGGANPKHPKPKHQAPSHTPRGRTLVLERHGGDAHVLWCHQVIVVDADHQRLLHLRQCVCGSVRGWMGGGASAPTPPHPPTQPRTHHPPSFHPTGSHPHPLRHTHTRARACPPSHRIIQDQIKIFVPGGALVVCLGGGAQRPGARVREGWV